MRFVYFKDAAAIKNKIKERKKTVEFDFVEELWQFSIIYHESVNWIELCVAVQITIKFLYRDVD